MLVRDKLQEDWEDHYSSEEDVDAEDAAQRLLKDDDHDAAAADFESENDEDGIAPPSKKISDLSADAGKLPSSMFGLYGGVRSTLKKR